MYGSVGGMSLWYQVRPMIMAQSIHMRVAVPSVVDGAGMLGRIVVVGRVCPFGVGRVGSVGVSS